MSAWAEMCEGEAYVPTPADLAFEAVRAAIDAWLPLYAAEQALAVTPNAYTWALLGNSFRSPEMAAKLDAERLAKARAE